MGIEVSSSFTRKAAVPLDDSTIVADITARNAINAGVRYEGMLVFSVADGVNYQLVGGIADSNWTELSGSGGGGELNYIKNGTFEKDANNTAPVGWAPYDDGTTAVPIDGTGGTANTALLNMLAFSSTGFVGTKSAQLRKGTGSAQGRGYSYNFLIDRAYRAKVMDISIAYGNFSGNPFKTGTNLDPSDITVWIYDIINSVLIQPSSISFSSNSTSSTDFFRASFQTSSNSSTYRLIFHVSTATTPSYDMNLDEVTVTPSKYVYGTPISDWLTYTPTLKGSSLDPVLGSTGGIAGRWRRVGDSCELHLAAGFGGTGINSGSGVYYFTLPSGLVMDATKLAGYTNGAFGGSGAIGSAGVVDNGVGSWIGSAVAFYVSAAQNGVGISWNADSLISNASPSGGWIGGTGGSVGAHALVPIVGWSSSLQMSDRADTRVVSAEVYKTGSTAMAATVFVKITGMAVVDDTHGMWDSTNNRFNILVPGYYNLNIQVKVFTAATNATYLVSYQINGGIHYYIGNDTCSSVRQGGSTRIAQYLKAGDYIECFAYHSSVNTLNGGTLNDTHISIERITGPSAIAANELVSCHYSSGVSQVFTNAVSAPVTYATKLQDTHGAWNGNTFTAPVNGTYNVNASLLFDSAAWSAGQSYEMFVDVNGAYTRTMTYHRFEAATNNFHGPAYGSVLNGIPLKAGETLKIMINQTRGANSQNIAGGNYNYMCIQRVGF